MSRRKQNFRFFVLYFIIAICLIPHKITNAKNFNNTNLHLEPNDCIECVGDYIEGNYFKLTTFPVDLDLLFWEDQPLVQAARLNDIGNGTWGWMLTPWGGHFISSHFEGADKWYFYCDRPLEMVAPLSGKLCNYKVNNGTETNIEGTDVIVDVRLGIDIGENCKVEFQHLTIPVSLHDEVKDGRHSFTEGDLLGYPTEWSPGFWTIDFHYLFKNENICPYPALSPTIQTKITSLYSLQYEKAKQAGVYPESKLCNNFSISVKETLWGVWEYVNGPLNSVLLEEADRLFGQAGGGITLLSRDLSNSDTFWRNRNHPSENMTSDFVGMFEDGHRTSTSGYNKVGESMVKLIEGDEQNGILELITTSHFDWGYDTSVYARFSVDLKGSGLNDDLLTIEYFSSLSEAQAGFTNDALTYQRWLGFGNLGDNMMLFTIIGVSGSLVVGIIIVTVVVIRCKKKKDRI
jgi:hypothetical protein